jgi:hypothetical protein
MRRRHVTPPQMRIDCYVWVVCALACWSCVQTVADSDEGVFPTGVDAARDLCSDLVASGGCDPATDVACEQVACLDPDLEFAADPAGCTAVAVVYVDPAVIARFDEFCGRTSMMTSECEQFTGANWTVSCSGQ